MTDEGEDAGLRDGDAAPSAAETRAEPDASAPAEDGATKRRAALNPQIRNRLATQLREMYDTVVQQPVPDRFADLIARLDARERDGGTPRPGDDAAA